LKKIENLHRHSVFYFSVAKFCHTVNFFFKFENKKFFGDFLLNKFGDDIYVFEIARFSTRLYVVHTCLPIEFVKWMKILNLKLISTISVATHLYEMKAIESLPFNPPNQLLEFIFHQ